MVDQGQGSRPLLLLKLVLYGVYVLGTDMIIAASSREPRDTDDSLPEVYVKESCIVSIFKSPYCYLVRYSTDCYTCIRGVMSREDLPHASNECNRRD